MSRASTRSIRRSSTARRSLSLIPHLVSSSSSLAPRTLVRPCDNYRAVILPAFACESQGANG